MVQNLTQPAAEAGPTAPAANDRRAAPRWRELAAAANLAPGLRVLAAGFAAGWFGWAAGHQGGLEDYIFSNALPAAARPGVLAWVLAGPALFCAAWLAVGALAAARGGAVTAALRRSANLLFLCAVLPLLPVFAIPGIEDRHRVLTLALVTIVAALALYAGQALSRDWADLAAARRRPWPRGASLALVIALSAVYIVFFSIYRISQHNAFNTNSMDVGVYVQVFYTLLHHGVPISTQHGVAAINHFNQHYSPIYFLLLPIYALKPEAATLLVIESIFVGLGALPLYLLVRHKTGSAAAGVLFAAAYLLYPALQGVNNFEFAEISFAPVLLLACLYFAETRRNLWFWVFLALALLTREDLGFSGVVIGLYIVVAQRRVRLGSLVMLASVGAFILVDMVLMPLIGGPELGVFSAIMPAGDQSFKGVIVTALTNPLFLFQYSLLNVGRLQYVWQILTPLLFLPLLSWRHGYLAVPGLLMPLLSPLAEHYSLGNQYPAIAVPFFFFLALLAVAGLQRKRGWSATGLAAAVLATTLLACWLTGVIPSKHYTGLPQRTSHQEVLAGFLPDVPAGASVSTQSALVPHLAARDQIYLVPVINQADYILFDGDPAANYWPFQGLDARSKAIDAVLPHLASGEYGVVRQAGGILLLRRGADPGQNAAGLQTLLGGQYQAWRLDSDFSPANEPDPQARGGVARVGRPDAAHAAGKDALTWGAYDRLFAGRYRVIFRLKTDGQARPGRLATVEAFSSAAGGPLAGTSVAASDFQAAGQYQEFVVDLETKAAYADVEYRVRYSGRGNLWVDTIQVVPLRVTLPGGEVRELTR